MSTRGDERDDDSFVTVELPVRLSADVIARLNAAAMAPALPEKRLPLIEKPRIEQARSRAEGLLNLRRERERVLGKDLFADPCWDMLLDLFVRRADRRTTGVSSACIGAHVPPTTALRHLAILIERGLVKKRASASDQRVQYVELSDDCFAHVLRLLLAGQNV